MRLQVIRHVLPAVTPLLLASCASSAANTAERVELTRIGETVQMTENAESTQECEYISEVPLQSRSTSDANAMRALRNEAGRLGANLVLLVMETRSISRAEGYLCADQP